MKLARSRQNLTRCRRISAGHRPTLARERPHSWPEFSQIWPDIGQIWLEANIGPESVKLLEFGQIVPDIGQTDLAARIEQPIVHSLGTVRARARGVVGRTCDSVVSRKSDSRASAGLGTPMRAPSRRALPAGPNVAQTLVVEFVWAHKILPTEGAHGRARARARAHVSQSTPKTHVL